MTSLNGVVAKEKLQPILNYLVLFSSGSTLICCALPSLFVLLGAGAAFASFLEVFPFMITISEYKVAIFVTAFVMLVLSGFLQWYARDESCPVDKNLAEACARTKRWSWYVYVFSWVCFVAGISVTYVLPRFL